MPRSRRIVLEGGGSADAWPSGFSAKKDDRDHHTAVFRIWAHAQAEAHVEGRRERFFFSFSVCACFVVVTMVTFGHDPCHALVTGRVTASVTNRDRCDARFRAS